MQKMAKISNIKKYLETSIKNNSADMEHQINHKAKEYLQGKVNMASQLLSRIIEWEIFDDKDTTEKHTFQKD